MPKLPHVGLMLITLSTGIAFGQRSMKDVCREHPKLLTCTLPNLDSLPQVSAPRQAAIVQPVHPAVQRASETQPTQFAGLPIALPEGQARFRFFRAGGAVAAGFNAKAWRESGALQSMLDQLKAEGVPVAQNGIASAALSMINEVEQVWVRIDGVRPGVKGRRTGIKAPDPIILLVGKFTNPLWAQLLPGIEPATGAGAILVGKPAAIAAERRRLRLPGKPGPLALEAEQLSANADFWLTAVPRLLPAPKSSSADAGGSNFDPAAAAWSSLERFSLTIASRERFNAEARLVTTTPQAAGQMMALYRLFEGQMQQQLAQAINKPQPISAEQDGTSLRFRISLEQEDMVRLANQRMAGSGWFGQAGTPVARNSEGGGPKIVIQGLETGPREIPLNGR